MCINKGLVEKGMTQMQTELVTDLKRTEQILLYFLLVIAILTCGLNKLEYLTNCHSPMAMN